MSDLLSIGRSGLSAYARALETVSHNIANAENPDYVRRSTRIADATVTGGLNPLYAASTGLSGARISGVARSSDEFLEAQVRLSGASRVRSETLTSWLARVETGLDNAGTNVGTTLTQFFSRGEALASAPFDTALRLTFLTDIESIADNFRRTAENLQLAGDQIVQAAGAEVEQLNGALQNLSKINADIIRTPADSSAMAGLLDARDAALAVITEKLDATVVIAGSGAAMLSFDGVPIAGVNSFATIGIAQNPDSSLMMTVDGGATRAPANGTLAGLSRSAAITGQRLTELDAMAQRFADDINAWHANGVTDAGTGGAPLVTLAGGAAGMAVAITDIADLALGSADGTPNGNLLALSALRGNTGIETEWNNYLATHANTLSAARNEESAATALDRSARTQRDTLSRVDLDREAADLIRLQQAYEASARVIQVARETVQSILAIF